LEGLIYHYIFFFIRPVEAPAVSLHANAFWQTRQSRPQTVIARTRICHRSARPHVIARPACMSLPDPLNVIARYDYFFQKKDGESISIVSFNPHKNH